MISLFFQYSVIIVLPTFKESLFTITFFTHIRPPLYTANYTLNIAQHILQHPLKFHISILSEHIYRQIPSSR